MGLVTVEAILITTERTTKYGGVRLDMAILQQIASAMREGRLPMGLLHDDRIRLRPRVLDAAVRPIGHGHFGVWAKYELDEADFERTKGTRGMSVAFMTELDEPGPDNTVSAKPIISLAADAHFSDRDILGAAKWLRPYFAVDTRRLYQFSEAEVLKFVIDLGLNALLSLPGGVMSNMLYEVLKHFLRLSPRGGTVMSMYVRDESWSLHVHLKTDDLNVAHAALQRLPHAVTEAARDRKPEEEGIEYDNRRGRWRKYRRSG